ncbi:hypothetical protein AQ490_16415 [Wenjunlia vitaminophila]|uniref:Gamma-glutamyl-gamma-aminobutyrate hydrolase family protein n=1 Tax=Wenjunlia vitaminophila TaxID=76728 RepID=A0A0T6LY14_WENVI|nr:hypothetical protein AQ490_16415 [Wenjunlia vitaminophila]
MLQWEYMEKVAQAGGAPVLLPPIPEVVESVMEKADALLLSGGPDVAPARYGEEPGPDTKPPRLFRDDSEFAALRLAEERGLPVLGICRGLQIMCIARGGRLHQHLPEHGPTVLGTYEPREIQIKPDSRLGGILGLSPTVYCHHHQGVAEIGAGMVATAWADDGIIEGAEEEDPDAPFRVGIQAHGELGDSTMPLFRALVEAASAGKRG